MRNLLLTSAITLGVLAATNVPAATFMYHGSLQDGGRPAEGTYDLELTLYSSASGGRALAGPLTMNAVPVHGGNFSTQADFGPLSDVQGAAWLAVKVRPAGGNDTFAALSARSPVSAAATTSACPGAWTLQGNAGNPAGSYLGTADSQPLIFKVGGAQVAQFDSNANFAINSTPIDSGTELTLAGSSAAGSYANLFMRQHGVKSGIQLSTGEATSDTANDAAFYIDQYDGGSGPFDRTRRFAISSNGHVGINTQPISNDSFDVLSIGPSQTSGDVNVVLNDRVRLTSTAGSPEQFLISLNSCDVMAATSTAVAFNNAPVGTGQALRVGTDSTDGNGAHLTPGGVWTNGSSRTFKEAFARIDPGAILDKVIAMPIGTWRYKNDAAGGEHLGPVAEDFHAAFGLGDNERYIATIDEEGVALAAIQGLNARLQSENDALRASVEHLERRLDAIEQRAH